MGTFPGMDAVEVEARYPLPPAREPQPLESARAVLSRRLIVGKLEDDLMQWAPGFIAASDVFTEADGRTYVHVVSEQQWWEWTLAEGEKSERCPRARCWPTYLVRLSPE